MELSCLLFFVSFALPVPKVIFSTFNRAGNIILNSFTNLSSGSWVVILLVIGFHRLLGLGNRKVLFWSRRLFYIPFPFLFFSPYFWAILLFSPFSRKGREFLGAQKGLPPFLNPLYFSFWEPF